METTEPTGLQVLLSYLLNRRIRQTELVAALGISRSAYNDQYRRARLTVPINLINVARGFGLNPLDLLVHYGWITTTDIEQFSERHVTA